jgi:hypothetical protein
VLIKNPSHRKNINPNQIKLLTALFKFRFISIPLLANYLHKDKSTIYEQLLTLTSQDYIQRKYDKTYRLPLKPAAYFLTAKGIAYLRSDPRFSKTALKNMYKNKQASEPLIERCLTTMALYNKLTTDYPETFDIFTRSEMSAVDCFLRPLPDIWLRRTLKHHTKPQHYLVEILEPSVMSWIIRKRIQAHEDFAAEDAETQYPQVLLIAGNDSTEQRIHDILANWFGDVEFWTTTALRLASGKTKIWRAVFEDDEQDQPILRQL